MVVVMVMVMVVALYSTHTLSARGGFVLRVVVVLVVVVVVVMALYSIHTLSAQTPHCVGGFVLRVTPGGWWW